MAENTKVQWADNTFNPWRGCTKVAAGCTNCYADALSKRNPGTLGIWGDNGTRVVAAEATWREPLKWNKRGAKCRGVVETVFCASLADVFEDWQGPMRDSKGNELAIGTELGAGRNLHMDDVRDDLFALIDETPNLRWLLLTKRPGNVRRMWPTCPRCNGNGRVEMLEHCPSCKGKPGHRSNVALIYSASTQSDLEAGINDLLACRDLVPTLGLSLEPLVEAIDLQNIGTEKWDVLCGWKGEADNERGWANTSWIDWVIVGGESGHGARPCNVEWIRDIVRQCREAGVACFVKQLGAVAVDGECPSCGGIGFGDSEDCTDCGGDGFEYVEVTDPKGGEPAEWPEDIRVREFPWEAAS